MNIDHKPVFCRRYIPLLFLFIFSVCFLISDSKKTSAQDKKDAEEITQIKEGHEIIIIDNKGYRTDRKGPSRFEHVKHARDYKISCWECHHDYNEDKTNIWSPWGEIKRCSDCHDPLEKLENRPRLQAAYHKNCKACHREKRIFKDDNLAYRKCTTCHNITPQ
ncbi:MAG: cytochrome c3 family protein [Deltaproteobacteria bacterium]|nr:cytochrome c3 family protein [Deltaproteobacteria bacterium]